MTKRILVPLDGSTFSEQALSYAAAVAAKLGATLHLVKVHSPDGPAVIAAGGFFYDPAVDAQLERAAHEYVDRIASELRAQGREVDTCVMRGEIVPSLVEYVRSSEIDLVIMTTHGRGGLSRAWLGSVADSLVRYVRVPLLLLRPRGTQNERAGIPFTLRHVLIPLDGSELAEQVVADAEELAGLTTARFTLLQVVPPPVVVPAADAMVPIKDPVEELERVRKAAYDYLDTVANYLRARGCVVDTQVVVQSQTAFGILEYALECGADLIAMATHGRAGLARVALGSIADKVLRSTSVPLLLKRRGSWSAGLSRDPAVEAALA